MKKFDKKFGWFEVNDKLGKRRFWSIIHALVRIGSEARTKRNHQKSKHRLEKHEPVQLHGLVLKEEFDKSIETRFQK